LLTALAHQEPDRVPLDLGATQVTGIHRLAYLSLREGLGLTKVEPTLCDHIQGLALPDEDLIACLQVDVRGLFPRNSHNWNVSEQRQGEYWIYRDEWGITHRRPYPDGLYYSLWRAPLDRPEVCVADILNYPWPGFKAPQRIEGLREQAEAFRAAGYAVLLKDPFAGIFGVVDVISQADDYGSQASQIISPRMFRQQLKPRWKLIFDRLKELAPGAYRFFHSCGDVRPLIPDFIELGVQILNPVHIRAKGMEPVALKRQVKDEVRRSIEAFAPGGGFVFNTVHNIQADVPVENILAMYEALAEYGAY
jgi:uroporphyrinogen decarboxylase